MSHQLTAASLAASLTLAATSVDADEVREFSQDCETALALSAAPKHLRSDAGVYVLAKSGYQQVKAPTNGYACLVERNHRDAVIPQCYDSGSFDANMKVVLDEGVLLRQGMSFQELESHRQDALEAGSYPTAEPGVVYMISDYNYIYNSQTETMLKVAPHVMFHAPHVSNENIGADRQAAMANPGLPIVNAEGPHGFMITFTQKASDSSDVTKACADQLPSTAGLVPFPPESSSSR